LDVKELKTLFLIYAAVAVLVANVAVNLTKEEKIRKNLKILKKCYM
jgi:hypothetical protein